MEALATTKMSSKGQVVIPEEVRNKLGLVAGDKFVVLGNGDTVMLKILHQPSEKDFDKMLAKIRTAAKKAGITKKDVADAIKKVRSSKK
jgi:AbrB family looped-hinge helix DNA binding protein